MSTVYTELNEGERNFLALFGLTLVRYHNWNITIRDSVGRAHILDRQLSFQHWTEQLKGHNMTATEVQLRHDARRIWAPDPVPDIFRAK